MLKKLLLIFIVLTCYATSYVQAAGSSAGREFWLSYFGWSTEADLSVRPTKQQFFVLVSSKNGCTGTIANPNTGYNQSFTVAAGSIQKIYIPYNQCYTHSDSDSIFVINRGILVTTSDSASVYLGNYEEGSYDACAVFPSQSLGTYYRIACTNNLYNVYAGMTDYNYASLVAVAISDNTKLRFNLANKVSFGGKTYLAHTDYDTTINRGQTLAITGLQLLGSTIESTNCKKFAVFSGNYISYIPYNYCCGDVLVEQMEPVKNWGKKFMVKSTLDRTYDSRIYVMADADNTVVSLKRNGTTTTSNLSAGGSLNINSEASGTLITATKPISVMQYALSQLLSGEGDPMMITINPAEQMVKGSIFTAPSSSNITNHYLEIFTQTKDTAKTILDGTSIGSSFSIFSQDATYSVARVKITPDVTHYLQNEGGFLAYVYGYDNGGMMNTQESYGYSLNWSFYNLQDYFNLGNNDNSSLSIYYQTTDSTNVYNVTDTITISRSIGSDFVSVSWLLNGVPYTVASESSVADLTWRLPANELQRGVNTLSMLIHRSCETDTINATLWLADVTLTTADTTICAGDTATIRATMNMPGVFHWVSAADGTVITEGSGILKITPTDTITYYVYGTYNNVRTDTDSITVYVKQPSASIVRDTICAGLTYWFAGNSLTETGAYTNVLTAANGCDSVVTLYLYVKPAETNYISATIHKGDSYEFNGSLLYTAGSYTETLRDTYGCDSLINILTLIVNEDSAISVPQAFSPNDDGVNDYFYIKNIEYYPHSHVIILNRWGDKVFEASPYENNWDGRNHFGLRVGGDVLPEGTYFYIIDLGDGSAKRKGYIFLTK